MAQDAGVQLELATGRYRNAFVGHCGMVPVGFTQGYPRFALGYKLAANLRELAPDRAIWKLADDDFDAAYRMQLDGLGFEQIAARLSGLAREHRNRRLVLLCYEDLRKAGESCHRQNFAAYWHEMTGGAVPELEDRERAGAARRRNRTASEIARPKGVTADVSGADLASASQLAELIRAWAEGSGHTVAHTPKGIKVVVNGRDVLLTLYPNWGTVYFEMGKLRERHLEAEVRVILGGLQALTSKTLTDKVPGLPTSDLLAHWGTLEGELLPRLANAYRMADGS